MRSGLVVVIAQGQHSWVKKSFMTMLSIKKQEIQLYLAESCAHQVWVCTLSSMPSNFFFSRKYRITGFILRNIEAQELALSINRWPRVTLWKIIEMWLLIWTTDGSKVKRKIEFFLVSAILRKHLGILDPWPLHGHMVDYKELLWKNAGSKYISYYIVRIISYYYFTWLCLFV